MTGNISSNKGIKMKKSCGWREKCDRQDALRIAGMPIVASALEELKLRIWGRDGTMSLCEISERILNCVKKECLPVIKYLMHKEFGLTGNAETDVFQAGILLALLIKNKDWIDGELSMEEVIKNAEKEVNLCFDDVGEYKDLVFEMAQEIKTLNLFDEPFYRYNAVVEAYRGFLRSLLREFELMEMFEAAKRLEKDSSEGTVRGR